MTKIKNYIKSIEREFKTGEATEHSYRPALKQLMEDVNPKTTAINEPKRIKAGAPDFLIMNQDGVQVGHIEAKNIGVDLNHKSHVEQFTRYKESLENLIITDYIQFQFFKSGSLQKTIRIGEIIGNTIQPNEHSFAELQTELELFTKHQFRSIESTKTLASKMAGKARLLADVIYNAIETDIETGNDSELSNQFSTFQEILIHDLNSKDFAGMYAQTITYGMFVARYNDKTIGDFSRQEAANLIPMSNPFLRSLFQSLAGYDLDQRISWVVDSLTNIFIASDVKKLMNNFGGETGLTDPVIHFYEDFLGEFDPQMKKSRGVWYTPEPIVKFMVRSVDEVLKEKFGLEDGLMYAGKDENGVHELQILDPATGTGTYLAEIIRYIKENFRGGNWEDYVEKNLIPRLHGFEILMGPYVIAHLKLNSVLYGDEGGGSDESRLKVFLTNSLEPANKSSSKPLFSNFISKEAKDANLVKNNGHIKVIIGNPPYSKMTNNNGKWITEKIKDYNRIDGKRIFTKGIGGLYNDYVKFIRHAQHRIEKNGSGVVAFINPHGFLDNPTFKGMRKSLLDTFDEIYILDLHGNLNRQEKCVDGSPDQNVFDIQLGVSINIFVKKENCDEDCKVFYNEIQGLRDVKFDYLDSNKIDTLEWQELDTDNDGYYFVPKDFNLKDEYEKGFKVDELFDYAHNGRATGCDKLSTDFKKTALLNKINNFISEGTIKSLIKDGLLRKRTNFEIESKEKIRNNNHSQKVYNISYRPFDIRKLYYDINLYTPSNRSASKLDIFYNGKDNLGLIIGRKNSKDSGDHFIMTNNINDLAFYGGTNIKTSGNFPLFKYVHSTITNRPEKDWNFTPEAYDMIDTIEQIIKIPFDRLNFEDATDLESWNGVDLLDYIYSILYSNKYRKRFKEFLKIDFPIIPYPKSAKEFTSLVGLGRRLRKAHLIKSDEIKNGTVEFSKGSNEITKRIVSRDVTIDEETRTVEVLINDEQTIGRIPLDAWELEIGGYCPAARWLKARKGEVMDYEDENYYRQMIAALNLTVELMREIDKVVEFEDE